MRLARLAAIGLVALVPALAGCGADGTKRAADPDKEVLRFLPRGAEVVAILQTDRRLSELRDLDILGEGLYGWPGARNFAMRAAAAVGAGDAAGVRPLLGRPLTIGASTAKDFARGRLLAVTVAPSPEALEQVLTRAERKGTLTGAGSHRGAALYRTGTPVAVAGRDGVLIAAPDLSDLRSALDRRDGDEEDRLDEREVRSSLELLEREAALKVFVDLAAIVRGLESGLRRRALDTPWVEAIESASLSLAPEEGGGELALGVLTGARTLEVTHLPVPVPRRPRDDDGRPPEAREPIALRLRGEERIWRFAREGLRRLDRSLASSLGPEVRAARLRTRRGFEMRRALVLASTDELRATVELERP